MNQRFDLDTSIGMSGMLWNRESILEDIGIILRRQISMGACG